MKKYLKEIFIFLIQVCIFYIFPLFAGEFGAMGMVLLILINTFILAFILGVISLYKWKFYYPLVVAIIFIPSVIIYYNESAIIHALWYLVTSYVGLLLGNVLKFINDKEE